ncbi:hypothetical protein FisN_36Hh037 [Fistulifera solaris]|uniref:PPIase cyclophilin-type domain-containing protein n=1 Tax=Fistulifera solaris TaxID=1519565 RepID=A0A1Z5KTA2_FISSO|nr:hypothetical protein FisN_36Hh037 [Fistulifera solaris]|eukprot:GAX29543.1 hypothetical protein FisN_36Hh037 [Fistulifera solaris]
MDVVSWWKPRPRITMEQRSSSLLPYGGDEPASPLHANEDWVEGISPNTSPTNASSCEVRERPATSTPTYYGAFILCSWLLAALLITQHTSTTWYELQNQLQQNKLHYEQLFETLDQVKWESKQKQALLRKWIKTKDALEHERSVMHELAEAHVHMFPLPDKPSKQLVDEWLLHRRGGLQRQVDALSDHLQHISRLAVLERFGPGPHHVKFTAELAAGDTRSFVVELYPVDKLPHTVYFFLDLVTSHTWDDTVFLHHMNHVMATAPIDYYTQKVKHSHFYSLGWATLGFPEQAKEYKHNKYTLGFSGQGPTFYINTIDNSYVHGPGSQRHHLLPEDADPCFGKVIEGFDVVDAIVDLGRKRHLETEHVVAGTEQIVETEVESWPEAQRSWTHIISVQLIDNQQK